MLLQTIEVKRLKENTYGTGNLSLTPLITFLQKILSENGDKLKRLPQSVLELIEETEEAFSSLNKENLASYREVFEMIYLFENGLRVEEKGHWALGYPIPQEVFYGTEDFYDLFNYNIQLVPNAKDKNITPIKQLLYRIILERFYNIPSHSNILTYTLTKNQVVYFFELSVDFTFVNITRNGELPIINLTSLRDKENFSPEDLEPILQVLDPNNFEFSGFTLLKFDDKTQAYNTNRLRKLTTDLSDTEPEMFFEKLQTTLSDIARTPEITCSLLPLAKLNGYPIASTGFDRNSIFFHGIQNKIDTGDINRDLATYLENPFPIIFGVEKSLDTEYPVFRELIKNKHLASYICIPLRNRKVLVGFLELYSVVPDLLSKKNLSVWHEYIPLLTQLTSEILNVFRTGLERVILDNFTALNPAVEWRFNEVAANHLTACLGIEPVSIGKVKFEKVYPIYGAIDVKGSTALRNSIYRKDNLAKVIDLEQFLERLSLHNGNSKLHQLSKKTKTIRHWLEGVNYERYSLDINIFLNEELFVNFEELKSDNNQLAEEIDNFLVIVKKSHGKHGDRFESSLQQLNRLIKEEVQFFNATVQEIFPSYFELFRSDGIEYDMYVGQSITPTQMYNPSFLHEIRRQQIISMARIARRTAREAETLPIHMQVTLLMFVHGSPIDISFREDERRFDVEGGYNIRYQMVKKRIDKARINGTGERLVSPNTIAIVYQGSVLEEEITQLLSQAASDGYVKTDFTFSTLEEISGVSDLRAARAEVLLDHIETLT